LPGFSFALLYCRDYNARRHPNLSPQLCLSFISVTFITDYGDLGTPSRESIDRAESLLVTDIMGKPISVEYDCTLIRALTFMEKHRIRDLPVVDEGKLIGIASRVDIGRAFLSIWLTAQDAAAEAH